MDNLGIWWTSAICKHVCMSYLLHSTYFFMYATGREKERKNLDIAWFSAILFIRMIFMLSLEVFYLILVHKDLLERIQTSLIAGFEV